MESEPVRVGERVVLFGFPAGNRSAPDTPHGTVVATGETATLTSPEGLHETLTDAIAVNFSGTGTGTGVAPGDSGGPAIDAAGHVVGVIEGMNRETGTAYLTPAADVPVGSTTTTPSVPRTSLPGQNRGGSCGTVPGPGATFSIVTDSTVDCATARQVFLDLFAGKGERHQGADAAHSYTDVDGWACGSGAGGFGCSQSGKRIEAEAS